MHHAAAPQTDHRQPVLSANPGLQYRMVDQRRLVVDDSLHHADFVRPVGEVSAVVAERQRIERIFLAQRRYLDFRGEDVDEQNVVSLQFRLRDGANHLGAQAEAAHDGDYVDAGHAQGKLLEALAQQWRSGRHADAVFPIGQPILIDPCLQARRRRAAAGLLAPAASHPVRRPYRRLPRTSSGRPNGVKLKKRNPAMPWRASSALTTRLGAVATSVSMPLTNAATLKGIISRLGAVPVLRADPQDHRNEYRDHRRSSSSARRGRRRPASAIRAGVSRWLPAVAFSQSPSRWQRRSAPDLHRSRTAPR